MDVQRTVRLSENSQVQAGVQGYPGMLSDGLKGLGGQSPMSNDSNSKAGRTVCLVLVAQPSNDNSNEMENRSMLVRVKEEVGGEERLCNRRVWRGLWVAHTLCGDLDTLVQLVILSYSTLGGGGVSPKALRIFALVSSSV